MEHEQNSTEGKHGVLIDYKNVDLLSEHTNPHARILSRRRTHLSARKQRELSTAMKRARFMALMPYIAE